MADIVGNADAFRTRGQDWFVLLRANKKIEKHFDKRGTWEVSHHDGTLTASGCVGFFDDSGVGRPEMDVVVNGTIRRYSMRGMSREAGVAICIAVAREFGDLDRTAALTLMLLLPPEFHTPEVMRAFGL